MENLRQPWLKREISWKISTKQESCCHIILRHSKEQFSPFFKKKTHNLGPRALRVELFGAAGTFSTEFFQILAKLLVLGKTAKLKNCRSQKNNLGLLRPFFLWDSSFSRKFNFTTSNWSILENLRHLWQKPKISWKISTKHESCCPMIC